MAARTDITFKPVAGSTPEQARDARARAWSFVFQCWQKKQEGGPSLATLDDAKEIKSVRATDKYRSP